MIWAVIMAGGQGTRFWPESRRARPKQFLNLFGRKTLLEQTLDRIRAVIPSERVLIVTQEDKIPLVRRLAGRQVHVIGEPVGRNTAPCLVVAAAWISRRDPDAVLAILPSDHRIEKETGFRKALRAAADVAKTSGRPVTFGIKPGFPSTGYGYLEMSGRLSRVQGFDVFTLRRFHEKPPLAKAKHFLKTGNFLWNSGMFIWTAKGVLAAAGKHLAPVLRLALKITSSGELQKNMRRHFKDMIAISIDYGLMEKLKGKILCIPVDFGWSDVGSWKALADFTVPDKNGNAAAGDVIFVKSRGNFVKAGGKLVALVGISNAVVVDTGDALLVCDKAETESIRDVIAALKERKLERLL